MHIFRVLLQKQSQVRQKLQKESSKVKNMVIERKEYISLLMQKRWNGKVKIITGIRRCGKSYLLMSIWNWFCSQHWRRKGIYSICLKCQHSRKEKKETFSLHNTDDFFRKIVVLDGSQKMWVDDDGVIYVGVIPFLLEDYLTT